MRSYILAGASFAVALGLPLESISNLRIRDGVPALSPPALSID